MTSERPWREWRLRDWNAKLFAHFFGTARGDGSPVSRIVVTRDELVRVTADTQASSADALEAFRAVVLKRLAHSGVSLCKDAERLERATYRTEIDAIPPYFAHLVVTCIAASGTDTKKPNSEFRRRLNRFLNRGQNNPSYPLGALPRLWEMLQAWLEKAAARGEPFRTLVLDRPDHLKLIGYSVELAFPGIKDLGRLSRVLTGLSLPPPVAEVFERIDRERHAFTERFQQAYSSFKGDYYRKEPGLYRRPFWSAVIDAARRTPVAPTTRAAEEPRFLLRLDEDLSWKYTLSLLADRATRETPRCRSRLLGDSNTNGFGFFVDGLDHGNADVGALVLDTTITKDFPELAASDLMRAVEGRLLLFTQDEDGVWLLSISKPSVNKVRALIRTAVAAAFVARMEGAGCGLTPRPSRYLGWSEVGDFGADALSRADFRGTSLENLRCLADVIVAPRITLSDGVRLDGGWLGRRLALPRISFGHGPSELTIEPVQSQPEPPWAVELEGNGDDEGSFRIPVVPPIDGDLDGVYIIRSRGTGQIPPSRVTFQTHVLGTDYRASAEPAGWFVEGIESPILSAGDRSPAYSALHGGPLSESGILRFERIVETGSVFDESADLAALTDILAGISSRRAGIAEHELYSWFSKALGIGKGLIWDVIRAWVESGLFDQLTNRRWRNRTYFARRPQMAAYRVNGETAGATLVGLVPSGFARRVEEDSKQFGVTAFRVGAPNRYVPRPICLLSDSMENLVEFAGRLYVDNPRAVAQLRDVAVPLGQVLATSERIPHGYKLEQVVEFCACRVECHKRDDAPDFFVAVARTGETFGTWSRNWAFLATSLSGRVRPFERRAKTVLVRSSAVPAHLPVALARWATITSGVSPGPVEDASGVVSYAYQFPNARCLDEAVGRMCPTVLPADLAFRARWLARLANTRGSQAKSQSYVLPESMRKAMAACEDMPGCERLSKLSAVPADLFCHVAALASELAVRTHQSQRPAR